MRTYKRAPVEFVRGEGALLWDAEGKEYLDFLAGISVCSVGHCNPDVVEAVREQAGRLMHTSNLFYTEPMVRLAERLSRVEPRRPRLLLQLGHRGERVRDQDRPQARPPARHRGAGDRQLRARLPRPHLRRPLGDPGACRQPRSGADAARLPLGPVRRCRRRCATAVGESTAAVLIEPIQGEAGIYPLGEETLLAARQACDESGALLIFDEIQTGIGRTGSLWAYEQTPVRPDVITSAKALGGGMPIGACVDQPRGAARCWSPATTARPSPAVRSPPPRPWPCSRSSTTRPCCAVCASGAAAARGPARPRRRARGARPRPDARRRPRATASTRRRSAPTCSNAA